MRHLAITSHRQVELVGSNENLAALPLAAQSLPTPTALFDWRRLWSEASRRLASTRSR